MITVAFVSHRVEVLEFWKEEANKSEVVILEEPPNEKLYQFLKGEISAQEYISQLDTLFPLFTYNSLNLLKELYSKGIDIWQIEPYLQHLQEIQRAAERGGLGRSGEDIDAIKEVERRTTYALIKYQEAFIEGDFDKIVDATIRFAKEDARRFKARDLLRAKYIVKSLPSQYSSIFVEAGEMHFLLPRYLGRMHGDIVRTVNLVKRAAEACGLNIVQNPGNLLTKKYILGDEIAPEEEILMAAQGLIYISLVEKKEMLPTQDNLCPHLKHEFQIAGYASSLSYEECRKGFKQIWGF